MRSLQIPETHQAQIRWLEQEMVGCHFSMLVAELEVIHGEDDGKFKLETSLLDQIREAGLSALSPIEFRQLLSHPKSLLILQHDVLVNGGRYWSEVETTSVSESTQSNSNSTLNSTLLTDSQTQRHLSRRSISFASKISWAAMGALTTAAILLFLLRPDLTDLFKGQDGSLAQNITTESNWGFAKFATELEKRHSEFTPSDRKVYLTQLAEAAKAWSNKRPEMAAELAKRLGEFRMGCSEILLANHEAISESDQAWLRDRCRDWARALDQHLADVEAGKSVSEVISSVDVTVTKIAAALLGRAETPQGKAS